MDKHRPDAFMDYACMETDSISFKDFIGFVWSFMWPSWCHVSLRICLFPLWLVIGVFFGLLGVFVVCLHGAGEQGI